MGQCASTGDVLALNISQKQQTMKTQMHTGTFKTFHKWKKTKYFGLWPPYVIGRPLYFCHCGFFLLPSFFPRLISAVPDWMSTILRHVVGLVRI